VDFHQIMAKLPLFSRFYFKMPTLLPVLFSKPGIVIKAARAPLEAFVERALWCSFEHSGADCPDRLRADNKR